MGQFFSALSNHKVSLPASHGFGLLVLLSGANEGDASIGFELLSSNPGTNEGIIEFEYDYHVCIRSYLIMFFSFMDRYIKYDRIGVPYAYCTGEQGVMQAWKALGHAWRIYLEARESGYAK